MATYSLVGAFTQIAESNAGGMSQLQQDIGEQAGVVEKFMKEEMDALAQRIEVVVATAMDKGFHKCVLLPWATLA